MNVVRIMGIRGVPAAHGGFETFAERLSLYLASRGWRVVVYCQSAGDSGVRTDVWRGIERVHIPVRQRGALGTVVFDLLAILHARRSKDQCLTLGYNTAIFFAILRLYGIRNVVNMDGIEWARAKWGLTARTWFWVNEKLGCWLGDHLIADHPEIGVHLRRISRTKRMDVIPYGGDVVDDADVARLSSLGLVSGGFATVIARPEPENSVLEIVSAFSRRDRGLKLVVLGAYDDRIDYHRRVRAAASHEVLFLGAIYDRSVLAALRRYSRYYVHGHQVGGTNPSLVEALAARNAVIAHDNPFNRWVAGDGAVYFSDEAGCANHLDRLSASTDDLGQMRVRAFSRYTECFTWQRVLEAYESVLS